MSDTATCNKSLLELIKYHNEKDYEDLKSEKSIFALKVQALLSGTAAILKGIGDAGSVAARAAGAIEEAEAVGEITDAASAIWSGLATALNVFVAALSNPAGLDVGVITNQIVGPGVESGVGSLLEGIVGEEAATAFAAFLAPIAPAVIGFAVGVIGSYVAQVLAEAVSDFNKETDKIWKLMDQPAWLAGPQGVTHYGDSALNLLPHQ